MEDLRNNRGVAPEDELRIRIVAPRQEGVVAHTDEMSRDDAANDQLDEIPVEDRELNDVLTDESGEPIKVETDPFDQAGKISTVEETSKHIDHPYNVANRELAHLVELAFSGEGSESRDAFGQLYTRIAPLLRAHRSLQGLADYDQEDLIQDTFARALGARERGSFKQMSNVVGWFSTILSNLTKDRYRRMGRIRMQPTDHMDHDGNDNELTRLLDHVDIEEDFIAAAAVAHLLQRVSAEKPKVNTAGTKQVDWGEVLLEIDVRGKSLEEYAQTHGISNATARTRLHRAHKKAREVLAEQGIDHAQ